MSPNRQETYANKLVFSARSQVLAVGAKADATDIQVTRNVDVLVLQDAHLLSTGHVVDLGGAVAAGCDVLAIVAESNTADDTFVHKSVDQVDIQHAWDSLVEDDKPVIPYLPDVSRKTFDVEIAKRVVHEGARVGLHSSMVGSWVVCDLWRCARATVRHRRVDLRSSRTASRRPSNPSLAWAGASSTRRGLAREPIRPRALVRLLERGLLLGGRGRGRRRSSWHAWSRRHLVLGPGWLLILGRRLRW